MVVNTRNRILSQNLMMTMDTNHTDLNNNIVIIGGSGAGKTFRWVYPNLMQMFSSFIVTDAKGDITKNSAGFMKQFGYQVKVLNLLNANGMKRSHHYNPLRYIMNDMDVVKLVNIFMAATQRKNAREDEQIWTELASELLQAFVYYAYYEGIEVDGIVHHDFKGVMKFVNMVRVEEDSRTGARKKTELDVIFDSLKRRNPNHLAVLSYEKVMKGAADTVRSVIVTLNSRTRCLQTKEILDLLSDDEMDIKSIGIRKTIVYCQIPDDESTFNFVVSMFYQQVFQQMYEQAAMYGGRLPVDVTFLLDEFANVKLPDDFCDWITTMRSRGMSAIIILQNLVQIKDMFKDKWENITGNCDTLIYLGGNEQSTHKYISEILDDMTIDKQTQGQTLGKQGSASTNDDVMGRKLMLPGEVRKMGRRKCLVIINGKDPVIDYKIQTKQHPLWEEFTRLSKKYKFDARLERHVASNSIAINTGGQISKVKVLDQIELNLLKEESKRQTEEYEEELKVAQITGEEAPVEPVLPVQTLTLQELAAYVAGLDEEEPELPESEMDYADLEYMIAQSAEEAFWEYADNPEEEPAAAVLEKYAEEAGQEEVPKEKDLWESMGQTEEDTVEEQRNNKEQEKNKEGKLQLEKRLRMVAQLSDLGFAMEQIQVLKPILGDFSVDQLTDLFSPEMPVDKIKIVLDILCT